MDMAQFKGTVRLEKPWARGRAEACHSRLQEAHREDQGVQLETHSGRELARSLGARLQDVPRSQETDGEPRHQIAHRAP